MFGGRFDVSSLIGSVDEVDCGHDILHAHDHGLEILFHSHREAGHLVNRETAKFVVVRMSENGHVLDHDSHVTRLEHLASKQHCYHQREDETSSLTASKDRLVELAGSQRLQGDWRPDWQ